MLRSIGSVTFLALLMVGCGGGDGGSGGGGSLNTYSIGGTVTGLTGSGLVLQTNAGDVASVSKAGAFSFPNALGSGAAYTVTVKTQPSTPAQNCVVTNGSGTVGTANIATVAVSCSTGTGYTVGGTVSGLVGTGLVLRDNGRDDLAVAANGAIAFPTKIPSGATYTVTVFTQPTSPAQTCVITQGSGTVGTANITTVAVACSTMIQITSGAPPGATVGDVYDQRIVSCGHGHCSANGFPLSASGGVGTFSWTWAAAPGSSLPPGLSLSGNLISGTPPIGSAGSYSVIVTATDGGTPSGTAVQQYTINILNPPPPVVGALPGPPGATLNQPYRYQFQINGLAPVSVSETGALPPGLAPLTATGILAGVPTSLNLYPITVHATDAVGQQSAQAFTIGVFPHGFSPTGALPPGLAAITAHTSTLLANGEVLVAGGGLIVANGQTVSEVAVSKSELFDPTTGRFAATGAMHVARAGHTATLLCDLAMPPCANPKVLIVGGDTAELYDPTAGTFTLTASSPATARGSHTATRLLSGKVLIAGGRDGVSAVASASAELFDPATGTFSATASPMASARIGHTATLLPDGRVLIAGGVDADYLDSAELYDPVANTFSTVPSPMTAARSWHTATLLQDGKVLIAGGATAELYDPAAVAPATSFTATGALVTPRDFHTAVRLPSGQVLIVGGYSFEGQGQALQHAELYDPVSGRFTSTGGMYTARNTFTLTLLGSGGQVLAVGGGSSGPAEVYQ